MFLLCSSRSSRLLSGVLHLHSRGMVSAASKRKAGDRGLKGTVRNWRILRGDTVQVMTGRDKGQRGVVSQVLRTKDSLIVEGLNLRVKHIRAQKLPDGQTQKGSKTMMEVPIHYSNVLVVDPSTDKPTRVKFQFDEEGRRVRVSKVSGNVIPRPEILKERKTPRPPAAAKDTPPSVARQDTMEEFLAERVRAMEAPPSSSSAAA